jgi:hypothetical protein
LLSRTQRSGEKYKRKEENSLGHAVHSNRSARLKLGLQANTTLLRI